MLYDRYRSFVRSNRIRGLHQPPLSVAPVSRVAQTLARIGQSQRLLFLCDSETAAAVPEIAERLSAQDTVVLASPPRPVPTIELSGTIQQKCTEADLLVVAGSGTLTDLAKHAAGERGLPLVVIPTAPSVDAYTSAKSALRIDGYHRTPAARVPDALIVAPEVIQAAPLSMIQAGVGDLAAKLIARLDWEVAGLVTGERFDRAQADWAAVAARRAIARWRRTTPEGAAMTTLDSLLVSGMTMQAVGSSRPAASAEHTLAHLWEIALVETSASPFSGAPLHGELVTWACRIVSLAYHWIAGRIAADGSPSADAAEIAAAESGWRAAVPPALEDFVGKMAEEYAGKEPDEQTIAAHRARIAAQRAYIAELSERITHEVARATEDIGVTAGRSELPDEWIVLGVRWVRRLRDRWSLFHLAFEMGWEEALVDYLVDQLPAIR